jgi:hypothetical protein
VTEKSENVEKALNSTGKWDIIVLPSGARHKKRVIDPAAAGVQNFVSARRKVC